MWHRLELLQQGMVVDRVEVPFGVREIRIEGHDFYLNGKKLFLRGYGDDCIYPETMAAPTDKEVYRRKLQAAKDYGFNFVRHHSHFSRPNTTRRRTRSGCWSRPSCRSPTRNIMQRQRGRRLSSTRPNGRRPSSGCATIPPSSTGAWAMNCMTRFPSRRSCIAPPRQLDPTRPVIDSDGLPGNLLAEGSGPAHAGLLLGAVR